jgi:hypothetical protein
VPKTLDDRWKVPRTISYTNLVPRPTFLPLSGRLPTYPAVDFLALRAVEDRLAAAATSPVDVAIWRYVGGRAPEDAVRTVHDLWKAGAAKTIEDRLLFAHVLQALHDPEPAEPTAEDLLRELDRDVAADHPLRFNIGVSLAVEDLFPVGRDPAAAVARLRPSAKGASPIERAAFELVAATAWKRSNGAEAWTAVERAYDIFKKSKDYFGLAQCALAAYQLEVAGDADPATLRAYANHAVYRNLQANRFEAASRIVQLAIVAMLADSRAAGVAELDVELARAAELAERARSWSALDLTMRLAGRLKRQPRLVDGQWTFGPPGRPS